VTGVPPELIPQADPRRNYISHRGEIDAAIGLVLEHGRYVLGENVAAFEEEFAAWLGARSAVGVASGTDAVRLALAACDIGAGDEVITVSHTAIATVAAIELTGAAPVLVDVDQQTLTIDSARIEEAIGPRSRAIVAVHLYGHPAAMDEILGVADRHGLTVVEDCAQAHGSKWRGRGVGTLGAVAAFSFYPTKNLGGFGDGGMVVTNDPDIAARVRRLREYGWNEQRSSVEPGVNSRLDEMQAAVLRVKLGHLERENDLRRGIAARYAEGLASASALELPREAPGARHVYHLYVVRTPQRDALASHLRSRGIGTAVHYPVPVHLQPAYCGRLRTGPLPVTERAGREVLSLPMFAELTASEVEAVINGVLAFGQN
jgi:dTDP-4-amino-4,6-dideoxygalactose transaminase